MYSYVARQPILNTASEVIAYELLFRDGEDNRFPNIDPNQATSSILTHNQLTMGIEDITGELTAFINFHQDTLINNFPTFLDPKKVVIEVLEDIKISPALIKACRLLKEQGYRLALDDYDFDPKWRVLMPYIDIVKVDVMEISLLKISRSVRELENHNVTLLAEKVETAKQFEQLKLLNFTQFQGYFFAKPEILRRRKIGTSERSLLELIEQSSQKSLDFARINEILETDPGLTYKLLRFINSPTYGCSQEITSLKHALAFIGESELQKFISLLALSNLNKDKPSEILRLSLARAKFCEQISLYRQDDENPPKAFLTGMLSLIDGILNYELNQVLDMLPIHGDIKAAIRQEDNKLHHYLRLAIALEQGDWEIAARYQTLLNIGGRACENAHKMAFEWADNLLEIN
ncbi:EAL and HDOD domain-containing protein [Thalassotalea fusca]